MNIGADELNAALEDTGTLRDFSHRLVAQSGQIVAQGQSLDFGQLWLESCVLAREWEHWSGQRLLLVAEPSVAFLSHLLACWEMGALPLIEARSHWQLLDQKARLALLTELGVAAAWAEGAWLEVPLLSTADSRRRWPTGSPFPSRPQDPALVLFTSGSSGEAKGVVLSHAAILANLRAIAQSMNLAQPASVAVMLPLHHSFALITQVLLTLWTGGSLHLLDPQLLPGERLAYLQEHKIERLAGVPTHFRWLCSDAHLRLPALKHIKVAGAALELSLAQQILHLAPQAELWVGYGLTEAGPRVSVISHRDPHFFQGSVGQLLPEVAAELRAGELWLRSPALMLGYLDRPELSAAVLQAGWLATGDVGHLTEDYLYIEGRRDSIFLAGGEKIAPLELEKCLLACPGVLAAAVYGEPDPLLGCKIAACVQGEISLNQVRRFVRQHLPAEKRPQSWYAVEALPLTANGKIRRKELAKWPKIPFMNKL